MHQPAQKMKYIVVLGGVLSGVGKGVATASIGKILKEYGLSVTAMKIDPYLNLNAGTLRPTEHGEVWVTDDGGEIDQDLGNYERFLGVDIPKKNCITSGQIYKTIIDKEIAGGYLGKTVQFIPHVPDEVKRRINDAADGFEVCLIEVGGTVGDYENIPFLFAVKSLERELGKENMMYVLVSYLPVPSHVGEMKTKPTQMAVKLLSEQGIFPDFILCRAAKPLDEIRRKKIEQYANIPAEHVISAPDVDTIYSIPLNFEKENLGEKIMNQLKVTPKKKLSWDKWKVLVDILRSAQKKVHIAMIGKYVESGDFVLSDSYISVNESLKHAAAAIGMGITISWVDAKALEQEEDINQMLEKFDGIVVPGGFGATGVEGKINAIQYAREHKVPYLGLCYGMQLAVVEFARNVCNLKDAHTTEISKGCASPVIDLLPEQQQVKEMSGTMRLGAFAAVLKEGTQIARLYQETKRVEKDQVRLETLRENGETLRLGKLPEKGIVILERHRHRFEQNPKFVKALEDKGMVFSGYHERQDGTRLMEFIELPGQTFLGTQAHPEFKSRLEDPSPLFLGFVEAAAKQKA